VTGGRPTYLRFEPAGTLAILHEPDEAATGVGTAVLMCPPFGWDEVCCSRSLRVAATLLARAGHPTARLTLPGTADGAGGPRDGDLLRHWIDAIGGAAAWLRERTGASRCLAFGIGLGGMLAYVAAGEQDAIDDLALWAVPDRGRTLLQESKSLARVIASAFPEDQRSDAAADGDLELIGYLMTAETEAALSALQLSSLALPGADRRRVLLLSRGARPVDQGLRESIERRGAEVTVLRTTDYNALMANPQQSQTPEATVAHVLDWLGRGPGPAASGSARGPLARVRETPELEIAGAVVETPLCYPGSHGEVFGIVSRDPSSGPAPLALLLLGAGALPHTGPNRTWVDLGRRWAARGVPTVRLDLAGIGEAGGEDPELRTDDSIHEPWRIDDVRGILDELQAAGIADHFVLGGLCSGAHCSLRGALADSRVQGLLLINLFAVTWSGELVAERGRRAAIAARLPNAREHRVDREFVAKAMRYLRPDRAWRLWRRSAERRQRTDAIAAFDRLRERGTEVLLLFGEQEPLYEQFARQRLLDQLDRWPNLRLERIPSRDHMFRAPWLQRHVHARLDEAVKRALARVPQDTLSLSR
jgi:dienelactone hydrolase